MKTDQRQEWPPDRLLFVYGTLRADAKGAMGARERALLAARGRVIGAAAVGGRIYDLGGYPGLELAADHGDPRSPDVVNGQVLLLDDPADTFAWLDPYEGLSGTTPGGASVEEYTRRIVSAKLIDNGDQIQCWAYVMTRLPSGARRIASGDWIEFER